MTGRWLAGAFADDEGLCVPGRPLSRTADLHLGPDGVRLGTWPSSARLRWDDYQPRGLHAPDRLRPGWFVTYFGGSWSAPYGVAVEVAGRRALIATGRVRAATNPWWDVPSRLLTNRALIPLEATRVAHLSMPGERDTLRALVALLARRPALRPRLADPDRARALIMDMAARPLPDAGLPRGAYFQVLWVMRQLGYGHDVGGRPVPGDRMPPVEEIVIRVVQQMARRHGRSLDPAYAEHAIQLHYLSVEPWPFTALVDDAPPAPRPIPPRRPSAPRAPAPATWFGPGGPPVLPQPTRPGLPPQPVGPMLPLRPLGRSVLPLRPLGPAAPPQPPHPGPALPPYPAAPATAPYPPVASTPPLPLAAVPAAQPAGPAAPDPTEPGELVELVEAGDTPAAGTAEAAEAADTGGPGGHRPSWWREPQPWTPGHG